MNADFNTNSSTALQDCRHSFDMKLRNIPKVKLKYRILLQSRVAIYLGFDYFHILD